MKVKRVLIVCAVVMAIIGATGMFYVTQARPGFFHGPGGGFSMFGKIASLGISDTQKSQMKVILRAHQPAMEPLVRRIVEERRALQRLVAAEGTDEQAIRAQVVKMGLIASDLAVEGSRMISELKAVLTPQQAETLKEMRKESDDRLDERINKLSKWLAEG
jgi:protein CpxP